MRYNVNTGLCTITLHHRLNFSQSIDHFRFFCATLRGGFGVVFKQVCGGLKTSQSAQVQDVYSFVFDTPVSKDTRMMHKYPFCPHPFVFSLYTNNKTVSHNERTIKLTIIGSVIKYTPYFVYAIKELGKVGLGKNRIHFDIQDVTDSQGAILYADGQWYDKNEYTIIDDAAITCLNTFDNPERISIHFLSPCRMKYEGRFTDQIEFHVLIRTLLRRISLLAYFHCHTQLDWDFKLF